MVTGIGGPECFSERLGFYSSLYLDLGLRIRIQEDYQLVMGNTGQRLQEASKINKSLMTLRNCIGVFRDNHTTGWG